MQNLGRAGRLEWSPVTAPTADERMLIDQYVDAHRRADSAAVIALLGEGVRFSMPPDTARFEGVAAVAGFFAELFGNENPGDWRLVPITANGQPAIANYIREWNDTEFRLRLVDVLRFSSARLVEITTFEAAACARFGLPATFVDP
jgi:RNA polymerase sigma-70 factor, ECF subfamily